MSNHSRKYSSRVVDGTARAPARAMLRATGFEDDDFHKPQVGIASTWSNLTPCNMHINQLAEEAARGPTAPAARALFSTPSPFPTALPMVPRA
ncbi:dihydroxy-acid dehydratase [Oceanimonas sp. NS1]|nr:dihydroxy-acid dehydratase [Oceanimonas sp. NS1]